MLDQFLHIDSDAQILSAIFIPIAILGVSIALGLSWQRVKKIEQRTRLMEQMLQRGMSPEEIAQVILTADFVEERGAEDQDPEVRVVQHLNKCWYSGQDVQRILEAARGAHGTVDDTTIRIIQSMASHWNGADKIVEVVRARAQSQVAAGAHALS